LAIDAGARIHVEIGEASCFTATSLIWSTPSVI
jgi:hypothetical protein